MITKQGYCGGNGNSVANYHWETVSCDRCNGSGRIEDEDGMELRYKLYKMYAKDLGFRDMMAVYRVWKDNPTRTCPECNGAGTWERWY